MFIFLELFQKGLSRDSHSYQVLGINQQMLHLNNGCMHRHWKTTCALKSHYVSTLLVGVSISYPSPLKRIVLTPQKHPFFLHQPSTMTAMPRLQNLEEVLSSISSCLRHQKNKKSRTSRLCNLVPALESEAGIQEHWWNALSYFIKGISWCDSYSNWYHQIYFWPQCLSPKPL